MDNETKQHIDMISDSIEANTMAYKIAITFINDYDSFYEVDESQTSRWLNETYNNMILLRNKLEKIHAK